MGSSEDIINTTDGHERVFTIQRLTIMNSRAYDGNMMGINQCLPGKWSGVRGWEEVQENSAKAWDLGKKRGFSQCKVEGWRVALVPWRQVIELDSVFLGQTPVYSCTLIHSNILSHRECSRICRQPYLSDLEYIHHLQFLECTSPFRSYPPILITKNGFDWK